MLDEERLRDVPETLNVELERLTGRYENLKADPGVDKRWLNKVVSRLQEVQLFATQLRGGASEAKTTALDLPCSCPMPGVIDINCSIHGRK